MLRAGACLVEVNYSAKYSRDNKYVLVLKFMRITGHAYRTGLNVRDQPIGNKLNKVKPLLEDRKLPGNLSRREEIVLSRLHIGHTHLTHSNQMNGEDLLKCVTCDCKLTVENTLMNAEIFRS